AAQALDLRAPLEANEATRAIVRIIRTRVPTLTEDRPLAPDIEAVTELAVSGALVRAAESVIGPQPWQVP
ncbi:MAG: histidine ammonia-lyase, partial [Actinomycetota bacterium]